MVETGRQGPWHPRGQGLLLAVVALSVVALTAHGLVALKLLQGTVHPPSSAASTAGGRATPPSTSGPSPSGSSSSTSGSGAAASPLHIDHACLVPDNPPTTAAIPAGDPFGTDITDLGPGAELQRLYSISDRDLTPIDGAGPVRECDRQLWNLVLATTSSADRGILKEFLVFDSGPSATDDAAGQVVPADQDASRWRLSLALNTGTDLDIAVTLAHELGHLITLNPDQQATPQPATCDTYDTGLGCLDQNAYLVEYLDHTWSNAEVDEWNTASAVADSTKRDQALKDFYQHHRSSFVDSYAATDPEEDFAESFALWCAIDRDNPVLADFIEGDPTDGAKKLDWFDHGSFMFTHDYMSHCTPLRELTR